MKITYGILENRIDVTEICMNQLLEDDIITIPAGDFNRAQYFTDPIVGVHKKIFILNQDELTEYDEKYEVKVNLIDNTINVSFDELNYIHSLYNIKYGIFQEEMPEQRMAVKYLTGNEKVLEIGGNIGRNSLVIAHILRNNTDNFVVMESDIGIANQLRENRDINNFKFHIENAALTKRRVFQQHWNWNTVVSDVAVEGHREVDRITYEELLKKYNIQFDTLVLDCEGFFYYILMDMPEILKGIKKILKENDYKELYMKEYVDEELRRNGFEVVYVGKGGGPCQERFYETWKKK